MLAALYGFYTLIVRFKTPEKFCKLTAMKEKFGDKGGIVFHTIAYSIVPIIVGIVFIYSGALGVSVF